MSGISNLQRLDGRRRVVITGLGVVTPAGQTVPDFWSGLLRGRSAIKPITFFPAETFPARIAGWIPDFIFPSNGFDPGDPFYPDRRTQMAILAADQAVGDAGLDFTKENPYRIGTYLGAGEDNCIDLESLAEMTRRAFRSGDFSETEFLSSALEVMNAGQAINSEAGSSIMHLARRYRVCGPTLNCLTACAAGSQAIGEAFRRIQHGIADIMISGGAHSMIHPLDIIGFSLLTALSMRNDPERTSRPFDAERNGFVIGEGAGILILEELGHALRREAHIYGEILGYGSTADSYRITDTHPEARGAIEAIRLALEDGEVGRDEIDYINAHGTSTIDNDAMETLAIKQVFGERAYRIPISSTKSIIGHLIAAAGAVEMVATVLSLNHNQAHPTINQETRDPQCDLDYIPNSPRAFPIGKAQSNSFGFGGQNVSLVVGKFE